MASTDATPLPRKNVAFRVYFSIKTTGGAMIASAAGLDSEISKDGGTSADCTNEATYITGTRGGYYLDITSTEMNADNVYIEIYSSTTDAEVTVLDIYPHATGKILATLESPQAAQLLAAFYLATSARQVDVVGGSPTLTLFESDGTTPFIVFDYDPSTLTLTPQ